jgi:hypothetical protein
MTAEMKQEVPNIFKTHASGVGKVAQKILLHYRHRLKSSPVPANTPSKS